MSCANNPAQSIWSGRRSNSHVSKRNARSDGCRVGANEVPEVLGALVVGVASIFAGRNQTGAKLKRWSQPKSIMKRLNFCLACLFAVVVGIVAVVNAHAARPNPPGIRGSVLILDPLQISLPHVRVQDEHGRVVADVEVVRNGSSGLFEIPLKKAGTYVVWAYQPPFPGTLQTGALVVVVPPKEFVAVTLAWEP